jgi:hypothetical protein
VVAMLLSTNGRHTPRMRGIQYAAAEEMMSSPLEYWMPRLRGA